MLIATSSLRIFCQTIALSAAVTALATTALGAMDAASRKEAEDWRKQHETSYRKEYVPLAGLFPLHPGPNTVGSAPDSEIQLPARAPKAFGRFLFDETEKIVRFEPAKGIQATVRGFKVKETGL